MCLMSRIELILVFTNRIKPILYYMFQTYRQVNSLWKDCIHQMALHRLVPFPFKGKINGIYTKGLLDRENFYKCLSLPFSDQYAF